MTFSASITAIFTAISECAKTMQQSIAHRLELNTIKEDKRQEKAIIAANKAFDLILQYQSYLPRAVQRQFLKYKKTFDKNIT